MTGVIVTLGFALVYVVWLIAYNRNQPFKVDKQIGDWFEYGVIGIMLASAAIQIIWMVQGK